MREKYGDVFTIYLGSRPVVVVNGYNAVKEVYVDRADDFLARGDIAASDTSYHNYGEQTVHKMAKKNAVFLLSVSQLGRFILIFVSGTMVQEERGNCLAVSLFF